MELIFAGKLNVRSCRSRQCDYYFYTASPGSTRKCTFLFLVYCVGSARTFLCNYHQARSSVFVFAGDARSRQKVHTQSNSLCAGEQQKINHAENVTWVYHGAAKKKQVSQSSQKQPQ
jgi:hypothetical protein